MNKESQYDHVKAHKQMRSYEKLKKMMANNRKAGSDRILVSGSINNPYHNQSRSKREIRKMKTEPVEDSMSRNDSQNNLETIDREKVGSQSKLRENRVKSK